MSTRGLILFFVLVLAGCGADGADLTDVTTRSSELRVSGPWNPPASTRAIAATQYVPVVDPPAVSPQGSCTSSNAFACSCTHPSCSPAHPGTVELDGYLRGRFGYLTSGGLYCCRQNSATTSVPKLSVHAIGRAIDLMVPMEGSDADNGLGDQVANWLVENAEFIGIQRVIWDKAYWNGERGFGLLSSNSLSHTNHIHVELSMAGAAKQTPFFTSGASVGSCTARCEGTRIINADCSSGDCAIYGAQCVPGIPPACGTPPPPEPPEATAVATSPLPTVSPSGPAARFNFVSLRRLFDTRTPAFSADVTRGNGATTGPLTSTGENIYEAAGLPAGSSAIWANLTAVPVTDAGFITAFPAGTTRPETSNVNFSPGRVRANALPVSLGGGDRIALASSTDVHGIMDITGAFAPTGAGLTTVPPTRVLDTRSNEFALMPEEIREIEVGAPAGATGVVATIAVIADASPGFLSAFPCGSESDTSNINYSANSAVANTVLAELGPDRTLCLRSLEQVHVVVDVMGYISPDGPLSYQPLNPRRLLDTRSSTSLYENRLGPRQTIELPIQGLPGMPESVWAVAANITVAGATEPGFISAFACGGSVPVTSSLNFPAVDSAGALSVSSVGADGKLCVFASSRGHLIVDVLGVWTHDESLLPPVPDETTNPGDEGEDVDPEDGSVDAAEDDVSPGSGDHVPAEDNPASPGLNPGTGGCATSPAEKPTFWFGLLIAALTLRRSRK